MSLLLATKQILRKWTLPIAMLAGVLAYYAYVSIPALDGTHALAAKMISVVQPVLIFCMLFVSFCKVKPSELRPDKWMLLPLAIQAGSFVALAAPLILLGDIPGRVIVEAAMVCMICPTATAASVVTAKLHGNPSEVVSYTCVINLVASLLIPSVIPLLHEAGKDLGFLTSFSLIIAKVFPLLILPLAFAWLVRYSMPRLHKAVLARKDLAFNLWAVALALAIAVTVKAIRHTDESLFNLVGIAAASLICCVLQFALGRYFGKRAGETIAGTQCLGQKNTVFAIWMGYTFLNPVTAMAGGFYSVWHNVVNSWQLYLEEKKQNIQS